MENINENFSDVLHELISCKEPELTNNIYETKILEDSLTIMSNYKFLIRGGNMKNEE